MSRNQLVSFKRLAVTREYVYSGPQPKLITGSM